MARGRPVSDAGTPLVSDPGYKLVREALADGDAGHAIPGASATLDGIVAGGLADGSVFLCRLSSVQDGRARQGAAELKSIRATLIFFEFAAASRRKPRRHGGVLGDRVRRRSRAS